MRAQLEFALTLVPEFWSYLLTLAASTTGSVAAPLKGCVVGLSTNPLDFSSSDNLAGSIVLPYYNGYANTAAQDFSGQLNLGGGSSGMEFPSQLFRQTSGGTTVSQNIAGLWIVSPATGVWIGGANFYPPLPIVGVGDGFTALVQLALGLNGSQGKVTVVGPGSWPMSGGGGGSGLTPGTLMRLDFTTAGTTAWVAPANVYSVRWRGIGGGAGTINGGAGNGFMGGGGGASAEAIIPVIPGTSYNIVRGAAGLKGNSFGAVTAGGDSMFGNGSLGLAKGGSKNTGDNTGGLGGLASACVGMIAHSGGKGGNSPGAPQPGAGGGSSAGWLASGVDGTPAVGAVPGVGGVAPAGGGNGGNGGLATQDGFDGGAPGGGAGASGLTPHLSGNGGPGSAILEWVE